MLEIKTLENLKKVSSQNLPIFSVFLKTDRKDHPFDKVKITLKNLLKKQESNFTNHTEKEFFKKTSKKIQNYVEQTIPQAKFHGIAIFAGGDKGIFETIELGLIPKTVQDTLVINKKPFLDIFDFYNKKFRKFALSVTNERETKLFLVQGNDILKIGDYQLNIEKKTDREGVFRSGKSGFGGGTAENIDEKEMDLRRHFKGIGNDLDKVCRSQNVDALIMSATAKTLPIFEKEIPKPLNKILKTKWSNDFTKLNEIDLLNKVKDYEKSL